MRLSALAPLMLLVLAAGPAGAARSYDNCTGFVDTLPAVISTQGTWCLRRDLATGLGSGPALDIKANNVTLDCNDFKVGGLAAGVESASTGIRFSAPLNGTLRNCNVRGFYRGVEFVDAVGGGHLVEGNRLEGNLRDGIVLLGNNSTVRGNLVMDTGGSKIPGSPPRGIATQGDGNTVLDNTVAGVHSDEEGTLVTGIRFDTGGVDDGIVAHNRVFGVRSSTTSLTTAIFVGSVGRQIVHDNLLQGSDAPQSVGIYCGTLSSTAHSNVIIAFEQVVIGCFSSQNVINTN